MAQRGKRNVRKPPPWRGGAKGTFRRLAVAQRSKRNVQKHSWGMLAVSEPSPSSALIGAIRIIRTQTAPRPHPKSRPNHSRSAALRTASSASSADEKIAHTPLSHLSFAGCSTFAVDELSVDEVSVDKSTREIAVEAALGTL